MSSSTQLRHRSADKKGFVSILLLTKGLPLTHKNKHNGEIRGPNCLNLLEALIDLAGIAHSCWSLNDIIPLTCSLTDSDGPLPVAGLPTTKSAKLHCEVAP